MIRQTGRVLRIDGSIAWIECMRADACGLCPARHACATGWAGGDRSPHRLRARTAGVDCRPGAEVVIGIPEGALLRAALLAYGLPLALLTAGAALGAAAGPSLAAFGAALGTGLGLAAAARLSQVRAPEPVILDHVGS